MKVVNPLTQLTTVSLVVLALFRGVDLDRPEVPSGLRLDPLANGGAPFPGQEHPVRDLLFASPIEIQLGQSEDGWTELKPSRDSEEIYVSSSTGDNRNSGLSPAQAKRTLAAGARLLRDRKPDWLYLRRGDTWEESFPDWKKSGRSTTEPMVVSSYGPSEERPQLLTGTGSAVRITKGLVEDVAFTGFSATPHKYDGANGKPIGVFIYNQGRRILFEDCLVRGYKDNFVVQGTPSLTQEDIRIRRCVIVDAYSTTDAHAQGIFAIHCDGVLLEENVFDHNGHRADVSGASPTIFNHNIYFQDRNANMVARGNIIARASSHGAQFRSGGEVSDNLFLENAINLLVGSSYKNNADGVAATVVGNVVLGGRDIGNHALGRGIHFQNISGGVAKNNIVAHNVLGTWAQATFFDGQVVGVRDFVFEDNIIYDWDTGVHLATNKLANLTIKNNQFQDHGRNTLVKNNNGNSATGIEWSGNQYYSTGSRSSWFSDGSRRFSIDSWKRRVSATRSVAKQVRYPKPERTIKDYDRSSPQPGVGTLASFMEEARKQSKSNWRPKYTGAESIKYFRANFGR